jgi:beta-glucosidase
LSNSEPLYSFYGLSYTQYKYDNLKIDKSAITIDEKAKACVDVTNIGAEDGEKIVQLYIRSVTRLVKKQKGFPEYVLGVKFIPLYMFLVLVAEQLLRQ